LANWWWRAVPTLARRAAAEAAEKAAALERQFWLRVLERWQRNNEPDDLCISVQVSMYIRELRRKLGLKPPKELIREQTRERVISATVSRSCRKLCSNAPSGRRRRKC